MQNEYYQLESFLFLFIVYGTLHSPVLFQGPWHDSLDTVSPMWHNTLCVVGDQELILIISEFTLENISTSSWLEMVLKDF